MWKTCLQDSVVLVLGVGAKIKRYAELSEPRACACWVAEKKKTGVGGSWTRYHLYPKEVWYRYTTTPSLHATK